MNSSSTTSSVVAAFVPPTLRQPPVSVPPPLVPPRTVNPVPPPVASSGIEPVSQPAQRRERWRTGQTPAHDPATSPVGQAQPTVKGISVELRPLPAKPPAAEKPLRFYHFESIKQRIEDSPSWFISTLFHLILFLVLALISTASHDAKGILLTLLPSEPQVTTELVEFKIEPVEPLVVDELISDELWDTEVALEITPVEMVKPVELAVISRPPDEFEVPSGIPSTTETIATRPAAMFAGRTGELKKKLLAEAGGTQQTEDAVALGLAWLKRQQLADGSWSLMGPYSDGAPIENKVSATAMAMIAFMGAGSTHRGGEHKPELLRAVKWLVKQQDRQGFMAVNAAEHEQMYAQAQAMIALCELYAMTGDSWIRPYAQASCDFAVQAQSPEGGWRYRPRFDSDTSVTGWFVMGLKSGEAAGLRVHPYVWPKVEKYLDSVSAKSEGSFYAPIGYSYQVGEFPSPSMTAEGLLCRQYMGWKRNVPGMVQGLSALVQNHPINMNESDVYYYYYATQSLHHYGGQLWTAWNDKMKVALPAAQQTRGRERGSWDPQEDAWGRFAGRLYSTCFSLYCLEVYYRHMPLYDPDEEP